MFGKKAQPTSSASSSAGVSGSVFRIKPHHYIHVLDTNNGVTTVICGPTTFTRKVSVLLLFCIVL